LRTLVPVGDEVEPIRKAESRPCGQRAFCPDLSFVNTGVAGSLKVPKNIVDLIRIL